FNADPAIARQLQSRMTQVKAGHQAEEIHFDTFNPADFDAGISIEVDLYASATIGAARIKSVTEITPDCVRRQCNAKLRHRTQDRSDETVAVRSRPNPIVAGLRIVICFHGLFDAWYESFGVDAGDVHEHYGLVAVPQAVDRPVIEPHGLTPADDVVARPMRFIRPFEHDPAVHREDALPRSGLARENDDTRRSKIGRNRQHSGA